MACIIILQGIEDEYEEVPSISGYTIYILYVSVG